MQKPSTSQVRQWARAQGIEVGERGRLPAELVAAFLTAHGGKAGPPPSKPAAPRRRSAGTGSTGAAASGATAGTPTSTPGRTVYAKTRWDWAR